MLIAVDYGNNLWLRTILYYPNSIHCMVATFSALLKKFLTPNRETFLVLLVTSLGWCRCFSTVLRLHMIVAMVCLWDASKLVQAVKASWIDSQLVFCISGYFRDPVGLLWFKNSSDWLITLASKSYCKTGLTTLN